ncbi:MAG: hypothetical protein IJ740_02880 [Ruminococcus sp.]|nr:hypothetical protein [Ruminococcus sp.]
MAERCRICGYRFRPGDGSLCPECFTAREDELKFQVNDFKMTNIFGRDKNEERLGAFLADEMKEERHEDISLKKELDREDSRSTNILNSQGAHVKNESFRDAFHERVSRDTTSDPGRVFTQNNNSTASRPSYNRSSMTVNRTATTFTNRAVPNPGQNNRMNFGQTPLTYNFPPSQNRSNYKKGSSAGAMIIVIVSIMMFIILINIFAEVEDSSDSSKHSSHNTVEEVSIAQTDAFEEQKQTLEDITDDGCYKYKVTDYIIGKENIKPGDKNYEDYKLNNYYEDGTMTDDDLFELTLKFDCEKLQESANYKYDLTDSWLDVRNASDELVVCTPVTKEEVDDVIFVKFYVPVSATEYACDLFLEKDIDHNETEDVYIPYFTFDLIDEAKNREQTDSSKAS